MSMMKRDHCTDVLSAYMGDDLGATDREAVEAHLAECGACRRALSELRDVVARAAELPELQPPRDLWPEIVGALGRRDEEVETGATVIALPTSASVAPAGPRRIAFTPPQLAAAAVVLIAVSAAVTWWAGPGLGVAAEPVAAVPTTQDVSFASDAAVPPALSSDLSELERVLDQARERLDPNTIRVIERNLGVIEQAIQESRQALSLDPENEFLEHHLNRAYERKLQYLREAARVVEWAG